MNDREAMREQLHEAMMAQVAAKSPWDAHEEEWRRLLREP